MCVCVTVCIYACTPVMFCLLLFTSLHSKKGKSLPLQAWTAPEGSRKLRFLDFMTTAQDGGRLSALRTGCLYPQEILLVLMLEAESTLGPQCDRKDFMSMKNPLHQLGPYQRPSDLWHSTLTTAPPRSPL